MECSGHGYGYLIVLLVFFRQIEDLFSVFGQHIIPAGITLYIVGICEFLTFTAEICAFVENLLVFLFCFGSALLYFTPFLTVRLRRPWIYAGKPDRICRKKNRNTVWCVPVMDTGIPMILFVFFRQIENLFSILG